MRRGAASTRRGRIVTRGSLAVIAILPGAGLTAACGSGSNSNSSPSSSDQATATSAAATSGPGLTAPTVPSGAKTPGRIVYYTDQEPRRLRRQRARLHESGGLVLHAIARGGSRPARLNGPAGSAPIASPAGPLPPHPSKGAPEPRSPRSGPACVARVKESARTAEPVQNAQKSPQPARLRYISASRTLISRLRARAGWFWAKCTGSGASQSDSGRSATHRPAIRAAARPSGAGSATFTWACAALRARALDAPLEPLAWRGVRKSA